MDLPRPTTLADIVTDGVIEQAGIDATSPVVSGVEFNGLAPDDHTEDAPVEVRLYPGGRTTTATRVARIIDAEWTWLTARARDFAIPELTGPQPASDDLIRAARTLYGNAPALLVPHGDSVTSVVVLNGTPARPPMATALAAGWRPGGGFKLRRALAAFAAARHCRVRFAGNSGEVVSFENGPSVLIDGEHIIDISPQDAAGPGGPSAPLSLAELRADAALVSAEHQLLIDGVYPDARISLDPATASAHLVSSGRSLPVGAQVVATIQRDEWRWAWADPHLSGTPAATAAGTIRRFGADHLLPLLTTPVLPVELARTHRLAETVKPTVGRWTHAFVPLPDQHQPAGQPVTAVVLLEHEQLRLPPATEAAMLATLRAPVGQSLHPEVDLHRAVGSYANFRGIRIDGLNLIAPDTGRPVRVTVADDVISAAVPDTPPDQPPR